MGLVRRPAGRLIAELAVGGRGGSWFEPRTARTGASAAPSGHVGDTRIFVLSLVVSLTSARSRHVRDYVGLTFYPMAILSAVDFEEGVVQWALRYLRSAD